MSSYVVLDSWQLPSAPPSLCYQESQGLPVVLLVGDVAIGQKLLKALGEPSSTESDTALGVIKNKYYSARVQSLGQPKMAGVWPVLLGISGNGVLMVWGLTISLKIHTGLIMVEC